jgi:hypothetical protein
LSENEPLIPRHLRRYAHIGLAAGAAVLAVGAFVFQDSDEALSAVAIVGFLTAFAVFHGLDERNKARERREGKEPQ